MEILLSSLFPPPFSRENGNSKFFIASIFHISRITCPNREIDGTTLANGVNARLVGKNVMELKDADGKYFIKTLLDIGNTKGKGWLEYKWSNQTTQKMELKATYVEKADDLLVACGIYK